MYVLNSRAMCQLQGQQEYKKYKNKTQERVKIIRKEMLNQLRLFKFKHEFLRISVSILLKERSER